MKINQLAAMTYTVRDFFQTEEDIQNTFHRLAEIGYGAVELFGLDNVAPEKVAEMLQASGLKAVACHATPDDLLNRPHAVADRVKAMGCKYAVFPIPAAINLNDAEAVKTFAGLLDECGKSLAEKGVTLAYHNHQHEFRRAGNKPALEIIYENTDPNYVRAELDTYWVQYGGGNPVSWCEKLKGRMPLLHLKDFAINEQGQIIYAETGNGNLEWKEIIKAADDAGCEWFIVEQDICPDDPFESLRLSFEFMRSLSEGV